MTNPHDLFRAGKVGEAIDAMNGEVRAHPSDPDRRAFLADMLCIVGNFDRADVQLEAISKIAPGSVPTVALVRQLIRAEKWRQEVFLEGRVPEFLAAPEPWLQAHLRAILDLREGRGDEARDGLAAAEELRGPLSCHYDGRRVDDFRDCDDLVAGFFEVLTSTGKYFWVPMARVKRLELRRLEGARGLIWRQAGMEVENGPEGEVYLPAIYAPAPAAESLRLGRATEWTEEAPVRGAGLRMFLVGDDAVTLPELGVVEFGGGDS